MDVYVASHCQRLGRSAAKVLRSRGFSVKSTWLSKRFRPTADYTETERRRIADICALEVKACDAFLLLAGPEGDMCPGGKFVEVGIAIGLRRLVACVGRRENMLLWSSDVRCFATVEKAAYWFTWPEEPDMLISLSRIPPDEHTSEGDDDEPLPVRSHPIPPGLR